MPTYLSFPIATARKRSVNLTISENLSATVENLLTEYVQRQQRLDLDRQKAALACATQWNAVNAGIGSFADEHTTL